LVDGQQVPVETSLLQRAGPTSVGRDAAVIGATTGVGAAIGAATAGGSGAAIGAGAGAIASTVGVLVTRGAPTIIYPETLMTFRLETPVTISTERNEQAFQPVTPQDYENHQQQLRPRPPAAYYGGPGYPPPPPAYYAPYYAGVYPYPYPYYYGGPFFGYYGFGPSFYFYSRPRVFVGGRFYRR
jgi:hypothetical protein